jgi:DNA repair exonuclease SbcCD ATPase subunit
MLNNIISLINQNKLKYSIYLPIKDINNLCNFLDIVSNDYVSKEDEKKEILNEYKIKIDQEKTLELEQLKQQLEDKNNSFNKLQKKLKEKKDEDIEMLKKYKLQIEKNKIEEINQLKKQLNEKKELLSKLEKNISINNKVKSLEIKQNGIHSKFKG